MGRKVLGIRGLIHGKFDSESELAAYLGWSRQQLNKITTGKRRPSLEETYAIAQALGKDFEEVAQIFLLHWVAEGQQDNA